MALSFSEQELTITPESDLRDLIPEFIKNRRKTLQNLEELFVLKNFSLIKELALDYCELSRPFGFFYLEKLGWEIIDAANRMDETGLQNLFQDVRAYLDQVKIEDSKSTFVESEI